MIDKDLVAVLAACAEELDALDADWALAGATAMAVHGYERATSDIDIFVGDDVREALIVRLRRRRLVVEGVFPPSHYAVHPRRSIDPERRVDLLFPALGVESLGLMAARPALIHGRQMPVLPLAHIVAAKLLVDPVYERERHEKDSRDLGELRVRGLIDTARVEEILEDLGDQDAIHRLQQLMKRA